MTDANLEGHDERLSEAIRWHMRLEQNADEATWVAFAGWLESDPANQKAYDRIEDLDIDLDAKTLSAALAFADPENGFGRMAPRYRRVGSYRNWFLGSAALTAALLLFIVFRPAPTSVFEYATGLGETRTLALNDGSKITLNTRTMLTVETENGDRKVVLKHGEALFQVVHDPNRPFDLRVGDRVVRDIGTLFDASRIGNAITVVVAEGRVAVTPAVTSDHATTIALSAGMELKHFEGSDITTLKHVDAELTTAWQKGYLIYRDAPLPEVVSDLNRYFSTPILLEGSSGRRFSGVLKIDSEDAVVMRLAQFLRLRISRTAAGGIVLRAEPLHP